jgi:hypothetical protein
MNKTEPFRIFFLEHLIIVSSFELRASDFELSHRAGQPIAKEPGIAVAKIKIKKSLHVMQCCS